MRAWVGSRYRGVGIYIGGVNRTCAQANLTAGWVREVSPDWRIIPIYMGHQAPCTDRQPPRNAKFTLSSAFSVGTADAADAVAKAQALGLLPGSAIYGDMENYDTTVSSCRDAVLRYLSSWTKELHRVGYLSGVYANLSSGAKHLSDAYASTSYARPDALWIARYDHQPVLTGWSGISDLRWPNHQRGKQYWGNRTETYGEDDDGRQQPVGCAGSDRRVPLPGDRQHPVERPPWTVDGKLDREDLCHRCDGAGHLPDPRIAGGHDVGVGQADRWHLCHRLHVSTPSKTTYSPPLPRCKYPYQVTISSLNERLGPSGITWSRRPCPPAPWAGRSARPPDRRSGRPRSGIGSTTATT